MIVDVLARVAVADAVAAVFLALAIYVTGNRSGQRVSRGQAAGIAILFGLPAALLYVVAWCVSRFGTPG